MKSKLFFIVVVFSFLKGFAQNSSLDERGPNIYPIKTGDKPYYTKPKNNGNKEKSIKFRLDSAVLVEDNLTTNKFLYDSFNNLVFSSNYTINQYQYKGVLDNGVRDNIERIYDSNNNIIEEINYDYDTILNELIPSKNTYFRYQSVNNDVYKTDSIFLWDENNSVWKYSGKTIYHFNQFDEYSAVLFYDSTSFLNFKYEYDYLNDSLVSNILTTQFWKDYSDPSIIYSHYNLYEYFYNVNNKLVLYTVKHISDTTSNNWNFFRKIDIQYPLLKEVWTEYRMDNQNNWYENYQWRYEYDNRYNLTKYKELSYDTITPWVNQYLLEQSFDVNDSILSKSVYSSYDTSNNNWIGDVKFFATYDSGGNHITTYHYIWDILTSDWIGLYKDDYFYDNNSVNSNELLYPEGFWKYFKFSNKLKLIENHESFWDKSKNDWEYTRKWNFYYTSFQYAGLDDEINMDKTISVYPNPYYDVVTFESNLQNKAILEIYNSLGEVVYKVEIENHHKIDLSSLESGVYLYKLKTNNSINQGKILKQ